MKTPTNQPTEALPAAQHEAELVNAALRQAEAVVFGGNTQTTPTPGSAGDSSSDSIAVNAFAGYRIERKIHGGGQGVVYLAIQKSTGKKVALKVIREGPFADSRNRARLERGVRILSELNHPYIVRIIDSGDADGAMFYVMDYISGYSLDEWLERRRISSIQSPAGRKTRGRFASWRSARFSSRQQHSDIEELVRLFVKICDAVHAAHVRGVIHRDLKPGNIRIDDRGEPHLLDFDLAKIVIGDIDPDGRFAEMTQTGEFLGSLRWASPEQVERKPGLIDMRTDVYALGVVFFESLTGQPPYPILGTRRDLEDHILHTDPSPPSRLRPRIDDDLDTIILKCMSKARDRRYPSAGVVADDFRSFLAGAPISARRDSTWYLLRKLARRHKLASVMLTSVLVTLFSAIFVSTHFYRNELHVASELRATARLASENASRSEAQARMALAQGYRMTLGWFLLEWHAGRIQAAKAIRDKTPKDLPEHMAMQFLLDPTWADERFLAQLSNEDTVMGYFIIGERNMKAGRWEAALKSYRDCTLNQGDSWYQMAAANRIQQITSMPGNGVPKDPTGKEERRP